MLIEKHKNELLTLLISMMNEKQNCGRILRLLILFCLYGICLPPLHAKQDIASPQQTGKTYTIKGVVLDFNNEPIIGASVLVIGTTNGSITNFDGIFTLNNVASNAQITISYIGMKSQTLSVNGKTSFKIVLKEDSEVLDEVVVVGYGTQKKVNLTGAVTMADGDVLEDRPIANVTQGLQGAIPNLNITFDGGSPNATAQINVRGTTVT